MNFEDLCKNVMDIDSSIRFAMVMTQNGDKIAGGYRNDTIGLLNPDEIQMSLFYAVQRWETRKNLAHRIGTVQFSATLYEKVLQLSIPVDEKHLLLISAEPKTDLMKILDGINKLTENLPK